MIIAVASGKGGTGKTTVSVNLARTIGRGVQLLDCDVEEPNAHLFLRGRETGSDIVAIPIPQVHGRVVRGAGRVVDDHDDQPREQRGGEVPDAGRP